VEDISKDKYTYIYMFPKVGLLEESEGGEKEEESDKE
jgi:hypothetical protein